MDPLAILTAALATATAALTLAGKIWDATPPAIQQAEAAAWGKLLLNITTLILDLQAKIDALLHPAAPVK